MSFGDGEDSKRRKRFVIIGVSSFLLVSMVVAVTVGVKLKKDESDDGDNKEVVTSMRNIKSICASTDYKKTCEQSLKANAKNTTDPKELIQIAFNVTLRTLENAANKSTTFKELEQDPRTRAALRQCKEVTNYAVGEIKKSIDRIHSFDLTKIDDVLVNVKVWLSAAISLEQTCIDGFQDTKGDAAEKMKKALKASMQLTRNGLAIVTEMSHAISDLQISGSISGRRLLNKQVIGHGGDGDFPDWVEPEARKLLAAPTSQIKPDIVVAKDGSGQFKSITHALKKVPLNGQKTFVIYIKEGVYKEQVEVALAHTHLVMIGDGADKTRITFNLGIADCNSTYFTSTFAVVGDFFVAKNIGFENSAGASKFQAVALRVHSDFSVFYNCTIDGYQDTLYALAKRQFYRDCTISGTIDFIFGDAAAYFQNCTLVFRKPLAHQQVIATAQGKEDFREVTGYVLQGCTITAAPEFEPVKGTVPAYLARPWKPYSKTIIMDTFIPDFISPEGYMPWEGTLGLDTLYYAEINNKGPGANLSRRVKWKGIRTLTKDQTLRYTAANFLKGDNWIPIIGVPSSSGMVKSR